MSIQLLYKEKREKEEVVSADDEKIIKYDRGSIKAQEIIQRWRHNKQHLRCGCSAKNVYCPVVGESIRAHLRIEKKAAKKCDPDCSLVKDHSIICLDELHPDGLPDEQGFQFNLILNTSNVTQARIPSGTSDVFHSGRSCNKQSTQLFTWLYHLLECLRFNKSSEFTSNWDENWKKIHAFISGIKIPKTNVSFSNFAWLPIQNKYSGGLNGVCKRLNKDWPPSCHKKHEAIIIGVVNERPTNGEIKFSSQFNFYKPNYNSALYTYSLKIKQHRITAMGNSGPFIFLAIVTLPTEVIDQYSQPLAVQVGCQSIQGVDNYFPVDSEYERKVAKFLFDKGRFFTKPLFVDEHGVKPDFILPEDKLIVEIQGFESEAYMTHKLTVLQKIKEHPTYKDYKLIEWNPNQGEDFSKFTKTICDVLRM